jgi:hypothetical protein
MGLLICRKHGIGGCEFGCPHVAIAISSASPCPGIEYRTYTPADDPELVEFGLDGWFCPDCVREHQLPPDRTALTDVDTFLDRTSALYRPMCPKCFEEWRSRGLGRAHPEPGHSTGDVPPRGDFT